MSMFWVLIESRDLNEGGHVGLLRCCHLVALYCYAWMACETCGTLSLVVTVRETGHDNSLYQPGRYYRRRWSNT